MTKTVFYSQLHYLLVAVVVSHVSDVKVTM